MTEWIAALDGPLLVFHVIAILATIGLVVKVALSALGFTDFSPFMVSFGTPGWTGVMMLERGASLLAATGTGIGASLVASVLMVYVIKILASMEESGNLDFANAIGKTGKVYLPVPPAESGPGQVTVLVQGRLTYASAYTAHGERIPSESRILVKALRDPGRSWSNLLTSQTTRQRREISPVNWQRFPILPGCDTHFHSRRWQPSPKNGGPLG